jgi:hypothetical protein
MGREDEGVSPEFDANIMFLDTRRSVRLNSIAEGILSACEDVPKYGVGTSIVDNCLYMIALESKIFGDDYGSVTHLFYHLAHEGKRCLLSDPQRARAELNAMGEMRGFVDLIDGNLSVSWGCPVFVWRQARGVSTLDLVMERVRVFLRLDMPMFFDLAKTKGIVLTWNTKRPSAQTRRMSGPIPGSPNAWSINALFKNGMRMELFGGFLHRLVAERMSPRDLINLMERYPERLASEAQSSPG